MSRVRVLLTVLAAAVATLVVVPAPAHAELLRFDVQPAVLRATLKVEVMPHNGPRDAAWPSDCLLPREGAPMSRISEWLAQHLFDSIPERCPGVGRRGDD